MDADDLVSLNLAIAADEQRYAACPLEYERAAGWHIEDYWRVVERGLNTYLHGANSSAKSRGGGSSIRTPSSLGPSGFGPSYGYT